MTDPLVLRDPEMVHRLLDEKVVIPAPLREPPPIPHGGSPNLHEYLRCWYSVIPQHAQIAHHLRGAFSPSLVRAAQRSLERVAADATRRLPPYGDLIADFFRPVTEDSLLTYCGLPPAERSRVSTVLTVLSHALAGRPVAADVFRQCVTYLRALAEQLAETGQSGFCRALTRLRDEGVGEWELAAIIGQVLAAGRDPVVTVAAMAYLHLTQQPACNSGDHAAAVRDALLRELRERPPFPYLHRVLAQEAVGLAGRAGQAVLIDLASVHEHPDTRLLAFGHGAHRCLGAALAMTLAPTVVHALYARDDVVVDHASVQWSTSGSTRLIHRAKFALVTRPDVE